MGGTPLLNSEIASKHLITLLWNESTAKKRGNQTIRRASKSWTGMTLHPMEGIGVCRRVCLGSRMSRGGP